MATGMRARLPISGPSRRTRATCRDRQPGQFHQKGAAMSAYRLWFKRATPVTRRAGPCRRRPTFDVLESRLTPTTLIVTTHADVVDDGDGQRSLREAITRANATEELDIIVLPAGVYEIAIPGVGVNDNATGDFDITRPLWIQGAGANSTFIDAANLDRVFQVGGDDVTFSGVTIRNGFLPEGNGGGIFAGGGGLTLNHSIVKGDGAAQGGGIYSLGPVTLNHSTVIDNVSAGSGGGIF